MSLRAFPARFVRTSAVSNESAVPGVQLAPLKGVVRDRVRGRKRRQQLFERAPQEVDESRDLLLAPDDVGARFHCQLRLWSLPHWKTIGACQLGTAVSIPDVAKQTTGKASKGFTAEERAAMRERAKELKAAKSKADAESDVLAKIAEMPKSDRVMAERLHAIVKASAPELSPRTWYGMPAYAKDGKVVCFFQSAQKFKSRYATLGFSDRANLDKGVMWPTSFARVELTPAEEKKIGTLIKKAVS
jgi:uncharacterized protein YdhG (YjbR/CyaY superfamily)